MFWICSAACTLSSSDLVAFVQGLINELQPDVVVSEKCDRGCRKRGKTLELIASIAELASHNMVLDVSVSRPRAFASKYDEAASLVAEYPDLIGYLPKLKRRIFDFEPRAMVLFEALALAKQVIHGPSEQQAAAMG